MQLPYSCFAKKNKLMNKTYYCKLRTVFSYGPTYVRLDHKVSG